MRPLIRLFNDTERLYDERRGHLAYIAPASGPSPFRRVPDLERPKRFKRFIEFQEPSIWTKIRESSLLLASLRGTANIKVQVRCTDLRSEWAQRELDALRPAVARNADLIPCTQQRVNDLQWLLLDVEDAINDRERELLDEHRRKTTDIPNRKYPWFPLLFPLAQRHRLTSSQTHSGEVSRRVASAVHERGTPYG